MSIANDFLRPVRIVVLAAAGILLVATATGAFARNGGGNHEHMDRNSSQGSNSSMHSSTMMAHHDRDHNRKRDRKERRRHRRATNITGNCQVGCLVHERLPPRPAPVLGARPLQ